MTAGLIIVATGMATTVQDLGRPGHSHLGVSPAGAVDPSLASLLNRLVGNDPGAAVLETAGGLVVEAVDTVIVAASLHAAPVVLRAGDRVVVPAGNGRQWQYLAVRGGLDLPLVLGSRSHDTMSGLGAVTVEVGARFDVGAEPTGPVADVVPIAPVGDSARVSPGPRVDWFGDDVLGSLCSTPLEITATSRVGVRLRGAALVRVRNDELPSEGLVRGAIQVPPDGDPIMMLADHPTTGGYPVVAVVHPDDVADVAQHGVGRTVRLTPG